MTVISPPMLIRPPSSTFDERVIAALYIDALVLADDARAYFDDYGRSDRAQLPQDLMVSFSIESLRVTTRLMHVIAWLLTRRSVLSGELTNAQAAAPERCLGASPEVDYAVVSRLPLAASALIGASVDLHARASALEASFLAARPQGGPARALLDTLEARYGRAG